MSETISAIASLLWPLIVLAILVLFRGPLTRVIRSTEKRDFTIKIAGQEVSVGDLSRQQMDLIADLHDQLTALRTEIEANAGHPAPPVRVTAHVRAERETPVPVLTPAMPAPAPALDDDHDAEPAEIEVPDQHHDHAEDRPHFAIDVIDVVKAPWERLEHMLHPDDDAAAEPAAHPEPSPVPAAVAAPDPQPSWASQPPDTRPKPAGVLWVDDHPERNALPLDQLERRGVMVDTARSTREAVQKLTGQRYQVIVSNVERVEGGKPVPDAGLELIRTVRTFDRDTPVVIYATGAMAGRSLADTATQVGADLVTSSWYQLSNELRRVGVR